MATNMYASSVDPSKTKANLFDQAKKRAFLASCVAHVLHDGYTDLIYVLLPIWDRLRLAGRDSRVVLRLIGRTIWQLIWAGSCLNFGRRRLEYSTSYRFRYRFSSLWSISRGPLGIYNFAGDLGKAALPGVTSLLLIVFSWHAALWVIAGLGLAVASLITILLPNISRTSPSVRERFFPLFTDCSAT
jgi:MFS transporter, FSR family, fosmidomycin resistance protein